MSKKNIKNHWNLITLGYQKSRNVSLDDIEYALGYARESELNLLGDINGKKVIELGCGGCENSIILSKRGAICTGVDMSTEQLKYAKNFIKEHEVDIHLIEGDIENMTMIDDDEFDIAISIFALDWMQDLDMAFKEAYRILKKNGIFVFSMQHPIYNLLGAEDINPKELKITISYFEKYVTFRESTGIDLKVHASKFSDIINGLIKTGFNIEKIIEPEPLEEDITSHEEWFLKVLKMIPSTLICKALKV